MITILDKEMLEDILQVYTNISETIWYKHLRYINITKQSKDWWNEECQVKLRNYRSLKLITLGSHELGQEIQIASN